jgi:hypothetical protein
MILLHVISLADNKLFLHVSTTQIDNDNAIMLECEIMHDYVRKHKPMRILESVALRQDAEIDFFVKKYMKFYGVDNVRGGTYSDIELTEIDKQFILREQKMTLVDMASKSKIMTSVFDEYGDISSITVDKLNEELSKSIHRQSLYDNETTMLRNYSIGYNNIEINRLFLADLKWLMNTAAKNALWNTDKPSYECHTTDIIIDTYKQILNKMKALYTIFYTYYDDIGMKYEPRIHLYKPETVLDVFFYHCHEKMDWTKCTEKLVALLDYYEYIFYCIICRVDEYIFDVGTYPPDFAFANQYRIHYLQLCINERTNESRNTICDI